ncbi:MAG: hypothetical protein WKG07_28045 [Hymenobacter sp.]
MPTLMVAAALVLAYFLVILDLHLGRKWVSDYPCYSAREPTGRGACSRPWRAP